jgi:hypothetical protein
MKHSLYEYEIACEGSSKYTYKIKYWHDYYHCYDYINSEEWYWTESDAENAAKSHIDERLENGEF